MDPIDATDHVTIVAGGRLRTEPSLPDRTTVIAADSGYDQAIAVGVPVDVIVGDLDSISPEGLEHAERNDIRIVRHPADKDATDLELALRLAGELGATRIDVHGGEGGSIGHLLAGALALTSRDHAPIDLRWHVAGGVVHVARPGRPVSLHGTSGDAVTIVPIGDVTGVRTTGLRWVLDGEALAAGSTRGVSNRLTDDCASVAVESGIALVTLEGA